MATVQAPPEPFVSKLTPFKNEPAVDFSKPENASAMRAAIEKVRKELGRDYPLVIGGKKITTDAKIKSLNPAKPSETVGTFSKAGEEHVGPAMNAAQEAFKTWSRKSMEERAEFVLQVARVIRERKFEFSAWMVFEVGKNWAEADADTAETIDFCELYARDAIRLSKAETAVQLPGERDMLRYIPLGVGIVIPPWNFPGAIMAGMTLASIVCGNTVILKPSSDSPAIARFFFSILEECGLPAGVVNFCPGGGGTFGDALVAHPKTRYIAFTGSREVGLHINKSAATQAPGQIWIKRTVLEMGGKDAMIVNDDADIDSAVEGTVQAAFGFQGQKCSACSRLILHEKIYDQFIDKLIPKVKALEIGDPTENKRVGPVVNEGSMKSILGYIEHGKKHGRLLAGGKRVEGKDGYYLEPTVFADIQPGSKLEQEEIFGPVLAIIKARDYDHALEIANDTEFGLTGAVYSRDEKKLQRAIDEFHVGNLYLNRKCTGAIVGAHPFGGFNMSGTDSKAGGPDYLYLFTQAKSIGKKVS
ncbi:MAG: L-glutamate gamma-semialdehyde dehydrogenase [Proteobacteria bacterium]|nr:MAG: L-glutamate gamma-semialdehyde dehydrogenase [Pseudomonadota bacterium]